MTIDTVNNSLLQPRQALAEQPSKNTLQKTLSFAFTLEKKLSRPACAHCSLRYVSLRAVRVVQ